VSGVAGRVRSRNRPILVFCGGVATGVRCIFGSRLLSRHRCLAPAVLCASALITHRVEALDLTGLGLSLRGCGKRHTGKHGDGHAKGGRHADHWIVSAGVGRFHKQPVAPAACSGFTAPPPTTGSRHRRPSHRSTMRTEGLPILPAHIEIDIPTSASLRPTAAQIRRTGQGTSPDHSEWGHRGSACPCQPLIGSNGGVPESGVSRGSRTVLPLHSSGSQTWFDRFRRSPGW